MYRTDGAGLACGLFEHLLNLGSKRPKVLAATHFHELFEHGFLRPRPQMALAHMEVRVDEGLSGIGEQVTYLYKFDAVSYSSKHDADNLTAFCLAAVIKALVPCKNPVFTGCLS
jgi:hypothetical protein